MFEEKLTVEPVTDELGLYCWMEHEREARAAFLTLHLEKGALTACHDDSPDGRGVEANVVHGIVREWEVPLLSMRAANELLLEVTPLAQRVLDGADIVWDGHNMTGSLTTEDAVRAEAELEACCSESRFGPEDLLSVWCVYEMGDTWTAEEAGITADTTDQELAAIEVRLLEGWRAEVGEPNPVLHGLGGYLENLRDELADSQG
ncbi:hypothetical protein [Streptomyces olivaceus]|uniref:hypothetical protein n=1 Tax=Streptomyces olivaceus TaxID=47716 RepID=UPI00405669C1